MIKLFYAAIKFIFILLHFSAVSLKNEHQSI